MISSVISIVRVLVITFVLCLATADFVESDYGVPTIGQEYGVPSPTFTTDFGLHTVTSTITRTHIVRKTSTSDVRLTSAVVVPLTVTQYKTQRDFVRDSPDTVTSFIRVTATPIVVETTTVEKFPVRTFVSRITDFRTVTTTIDLWHKVTHYQTSFEVVRLPVVETQTLLQVLYDTVTVTSKIIVTSLHGDFGYGYGY